MDFVLKYAGVVALVILVIVGATYWLHSSSNSQLSGATACSQITCLSGGLRLVADAGGDFETDIAAVFNAGMTTTGTTTSNGNVVIPTSNTATSSIQVGCIQTVATSTATPIHLVIGSTLFGTTTFSGTSNGFVAWQFGKCSGV